MEVHIKKMHPSAVIPTYAHPTDAGLDLVAVSKKYDEFGNTVYDTGIAVEIPKGYVGLVFPRSSNSKKDLILTNCVGVIDSGYRGPISFKYRSLIVRVPFWNVIKKLFGLKHGRYFVIRGKEYEVGDRIGQLIIIPYPQIEFVEVEELAESDRGLGSYGSTGK